MQTIDYVIIATAAGVIGYVVFLVVVFILPRKLRSQNLMQKQLIVEEARERQRTIQAEEIQRFEVQMQLAKDELEDAIAARERDLSSEDHELESRSEFLAQEEARLQRLEKELELHKGRSERLRLEWEQADLALKSGMNEVRTKLAQAAKQDVKVLEQALIQDRIQSKQLEATKYLKLLADELETSVNRLANRALARVHSRYAPEFIWPKGVNHVELSDRKIAEELAQEDCALIKELTELSEGVTITVDGVVEEKQTPLVRFAGGYGIFKEAAKLALEELLQLGHGQWGRARDIYLKHRRNLEQKALQMGKQALVDLKLNQMHVEILKMVGALNWRTSYRQNQYYHSVEVAKLAGVLAAELGVDEEAAKRSGLLHDIGKSIDYRIEGSHAVISGDYADRYGEAKFICDTVMSHHADLIVETPLAYVLRAADTLSGARPGARVNLEEGYQERLSSIQDVVRAFPGVNKVEIMNGAREIHIEVNHKRIAESDLDSLTKSIARKIEENVAFPGQIKVLVSRRFEAVAVA